MMMQNSIFRTEIVFLASLLGLVAIPVLGQQDQGQIAGTVLDASSASVSRARVTATSIQGVSRSVDTGENGSYVLTNLPVGLYDVSVQAAGFKRFTRTGVKVDIAARSTVDVELFFEQFIDGFINIEWWTAWSCYLQPSVKPKTTRALRIKLDFAPTNLEGRRLTWFVWLASFSPITHLIIVPA